MDLLSTGAKITSQPSRQRLLHSDGVLIFSDKLFVDLLEEELVVASILAPDSAYEAAPLVGVSGRYLLRDCIEYAVGIWFGLSVVLGLAKGYWSYRWSDHVAGSTCLLGNLPA